MPTELARRLHAVLVTVAAGLVAEVDPLETRFPRPNQSRNLWPTADISGTLVTGERFIVEVDEHADPTRSVVKYWPLLEAMRNGTIEHPPIMFVEVSRRDDTFGRGFQDLAVFAGAQFMELYGSHYRFGYVKLDPEDLGGVAKRVVAYFVERVA